MSEAFVCSCVHTPRGEACARAGTRLEERRVCARAGTRLEERRVLVRAHA
jgi:hypothetical protein